LLIWEPQQASEASTEEGEKGGAGLKDHFIKEKLEKGKAGNKQGRDVQKSKWESDHHSKSSAKRAEVLVIFPNGVEVWTWSKKREACGRKTGGKGRL